MSSNEKKTGAPLGRVGLIAIVVIVLFIGLILLLCTKRVPAGYVGVIYNISNGVTDEVVSQGWKVLPPTKKVTLYSIGIEQSYLTSEDKGDSPKDESFRTPTSDGKSVTVDLEFSYYFDTERVAETFVRFKGQDGKTVKDTFIKPKISAWTQEVTSTYQVADIFGDKRSEINQELDRYLKEKFYQYGIIIDTVNFTNISVDDETAKAIQKKVNAQQELELANIEAKTAEVNANKDKEVATIEAEKEKEIATINAEKASIQAQGEADALKIKTQGEADAIKIEAAAEAAANKMISESLTPELIEKTKIEKWNGDVPSVQGTSAAPIISLD